MLMRNMHRWMAHGMVLIVLLHMMRVFYTGAYKPPREFNWVVGVDPAGADAAALSFTGYLLPWDQLAFWAITVGTNMVGSAPVLGEPNRFVLLGGFEVGPNALIRFYTLHVIGSAAAGRDLHGRALLAHPPRRRPGPAAVSRGGVTYDGDRQLQTAASPAVPAARAAARGRAARLAGPRIRRVHLARVAVHDHLHGAVVADQRAAARPRERRTYTPNPSKAPWYFLNLQELLLHMNPALAGVIVPTVALIVLGAIPYFDREQRGPGRVVRHAGSVEAHVDRRCGRDRGFAAADPLGRR